MRNVKQIILCLIFLFNNSVLISQSYLGITTHKVNMREGPGTEYEIIQLLKQDSYLFLYTIDTENDFYFVIDVETNNEGFVHRKYVSILNEIDKNKEGIFTPLQKTSSHNSTIEIYNNTNKTLTLKMNDTRYTFKSYEKKTLEFSPGIYDYYASAPLVIPDYGTEKLESNYLYEWEFYIVTTTSPIGRKKRK